MSNYNGARRKTTVGNRNAQSSETGGKSKKYIPPNSGGDGWGNAGKRPSRSNSDDGWGENNRGPSNYASSDIWGDLPSQPAAQENAWEKRGYRTSQKSHTNQGKKTVPLVGPNFSWDDDDEYPALESRPPVENVWEKRKEKLEGRKAMEPTNLTEEELMIKKAIELSKLEAQEEEERRRLIEEEYELQNVILATNPQLFSDFLTPYELDEANESLESETTEYQSNDVTNGYIANESIWNYPEPVESPQKQSKKAVKKKKRNKSQSSTHMEDEITTPNAWPDSQKFDHNKQNESIFSEQTEYQEIQDNWSQNSVSKIVYNKAEENVDEDSDDLSTELTSTMSPEADDESKLHKGSQPKIIDVFGGWGSKNTQNSNLKSSYKQERFESYDNHSSATSVSNNEEIFQDDWEKIKEMSELDENLQFPKYSSECKEVENVSKNEKGQSLVNEEDSWNIKYSSNVEHSSNELKHSLYSHVESNIAASASSFCNAVINSSDTGDSYLCKKSVPKDDIMNNIVQDYASLAVKCADPSTKENVTVQRKPTDIFSSVTTLLNEDNLKPDLHHLHVSEPQNSSIPVSNQTAEKEIMYTLNNTAPGEFSAKAPNENITASWNDSKAVFFTNSERNETNDGSFLPHINDSVQDIHTAHESNPADPVIPPPPVQSKINFPCQSNPVMANLINTNLMMSMNPLMMQQQMMMLNNPFFLQQLHQMEMYYRTMSMPFAPLIHPMQVPPFNPILNNPMGSCFNGQPNSSTNPVPEQSVESNPSVPPPCHEFENGKQRSMSPKASVEFENSWLSDLLSEGAAHMDSYIPPPTMPVTNPPKNPHSTPNVENKVGMNIAQDILRSEYENETIPRNFNCDVKSLKHESSVLKYGRTDVDANRENVNSDSAPRSLVPDAVEASGWGDMPENNYNSWNNDADGWADGKETTSKSMIRSSIYASRKQTTTRQPRQNSQWR